MTIAYLLKMYPRFSETFVLNEILELERQGVDVRIYSLRKPDDGRFHAHLARVRAPVIYLPQHLLAEAGPILAAQRAFARTWPRRYLRILLYALSRRNAIAPKRFFVAVVLAEHLRRHPVDHLHAHFASSPARVGMYVHLLTGVPYSFTAHAKDIFLKTIDIPLLRDKIRTAKFVVTVSDYNREYLLRLAAGDKCTALGSLIQPDAVTIQPDQVRRLYNGIDLTLFDGRGVHIMHAQPKPLILGVGRLIEKKGFDILIRACAILKQQGVDFQCEIVGKGPLEHQLRGLIGELELTAHVRLTGPRPQDEIVKLYERAAVFALPCVVGADGNRDGLPTVMLEAMAMRVPVVSTDITGVPEIVEDGTTGLLIPQNDPAALAVALVRLLADPFLRERMGEVARAQVVDKFNLSKNVSVLRQWLTGQPRMDSVYLPNLSDDRHAPRAQVIT